jgi:hypothetical protein
MTNSKNAGRVAQGRMIRRYGATAAPEIRLGPGDAQEAACGLINGLLLAAGTLFLPPNRPWLRSEGSRVEWVTQWARSGYRRRIRDAEGARKHHGAACP